MSDTAARTDWRKKLGTFLRIAEIRLRFVMLMIVTGIVAAKWDAITARWDRFRPRPPSRRSVSQATTK